MTAPPPIQYAPAPCPACGAANVREAALRCKIRFDETGEASCPGDVEDPEGRILQPTRESLQALDRWIDAEARRQGW